MVVQIKIFVFAFIICRDIDMIDIPVMLNATTTRLFFLMIST